MIPIIKPFLGQEEADAAAEAVLSGWVSQGPRVRQFEQQMAERTGAAAGIAVSSCTTGLHLALVGAGVVAGDEVVVPSLSFIATANSVRYCGAEPVFADVDPVTQNITPQTVAAVITPKTRAVMAVHQVGMPADIDALQALCDARGVTLIEDAACAIGSTYKGAMIGGHTAFSVFSFHPRKLLTTGEGGMVMCRDEGSDERLRILRQHAMSVNDVARHASKTFIFEQYTEVGFNYRLTDIQAAVGLVQLGRLDAVISRRRTLADRYAELLGDIDGILLPSDPAWGTTNYQSYCVKLLEGGRARRDGVLNAMHAAKIGVKRGIMAAHLEPAYEGHPHGSLVQTEKWTHESFVLPLYHTMTTDEQDRVVAAVRASL